jgi:2-polyprenyl-3-methyl-5-hydroxy-6-metoxy-1,4-benzoquinol methylase
MTNPSEVAQHYHSGHLLKRISDGCAMLKLTPPIALDALAQVDEFHIGGRLATAPFVRALQLSKGSRVVDLGCGLGGPARYVATETGACVIGIDLTAEFVETGRVLTEWTGLTDQVQLRKRPVNQQLPVQSFDQFHGMSSSILMILWSAT